VYPINCCADADWSEQTGLACQDAITNALQAYDKIAKLNGTGKVARIIVCWENSVKLGKGDPNQDIVVSHCHIVLSTARPPLPKVQAPLFSTYRVSRLMKEETAQVGKQSNAAA
jgi:hypothetical protein